ncbi:MAG: chemotaxis protein CheA, partial [Candidatus Omnitrophota bacterium]
LDRVVLDEIGDPLIHLIRNAIDHGIETPQERRKVGKPSRGKVLIKVSREKGHIIIEISDDGRGIDVDKVVATAAEKGLISPQEVSKNDYRQILDILTTPGFSTSEKVTDVSGRGVGLDVVRNKLDALGGRLDLETQRGKGTKFILTLPLTLAIIKAMLVLVGEQIYAIPLMNIRETVKIREAELKRIKDIEVMRLREEIIPILRLDKELGMKTTVTQEKKEEISIVIVEGRTKSMGLVVDKVIGEQDIVVKPLGSFVKRIKGIAGGTILGDGRVALILDVVNIK